MKEFQQRVVDEKRDLDDKLTKLRDFIHGATFDGLPTDERMRMWNQERHMEGYSKILGDRIQHFFE